MFQKTLCAVGKGGQLECSRPYGTPYGNPLSSQTPLNRAAGANSCLSFPANPSQG